MRRRYRRPPGIPAPLTPNSGAWGVPSPNALADAGLASFDTDPNTANLVSPVPFEYTNSIPIYDSILNANTAIVQAQPLKFTLLDDGSTVDPTLSTIYGIKTIQTPAQMVGVVDGIYPYIRLAGGLDQDYFFSNFGYLGNVTAIWTITINGRAAAGYASIDWIRANFAQQPSDRPLLYLRPGEAVGVVFTYADLTMMFYNCQVGIRITGYFSPMNAVGGTGWTPSSNANSAPRRW